MVLAPSITPLTVLAVAICITCLPWFGVERGGDSQVLSQPDPSVELRAQLLEAHRELRGHCETQLATCRRTCPEQKVLFVLLALLGATLPCPLGLDGLRGDWPFPERRSRLAEDRAYREAARCLCMPSVAEEASWRHLHPGSRVLLWYEGDTVWHERMLLAATCEDQREWMMVTPDSDIYYESFRTDVSRVIVLGVRPPLNDPVYGFADAIGTDAARGLIADGLNEAIRRGVELGATPPERSLLVTWDGQRVRTQGAIENTTWPGGGRTHGRQDRRSPRCSQWRCHTSGPGFRPLLGLKMGLGM